MSDVNNNPAEETKKTQAELNDATAAAVVKRVGYFVKETVGVLNDVGIGIGTFDGHFESLFHNVFNTMVNKYSLEVNG
jgi:hypothetical protein